VRAFGQRVLRRIISHRSKDLAAQLAFWALLATFPFTIFLLTLIGYVPLHGLEKQLLSMVYNVMPEQAATLLDKTVHEVLHRQRGWLTIVSLLGWMWSASGALGSTVNALNLAHGVAETRPWLKRRVMFVGLTAAAAGAIIVATSGLVFGPGLLKAIMKLFGFGGGRKALAVWTWIRWPIVVGDVLVLLACVYHFLPNLDLGRKRFRVITPGAIAAVVVWIAASLAFKGYVAHFGSYAKTYGTLGGAVVLILWLYLSAFVVVLGGEVNAAWEEGRQAETISPPVETAIAVSSTAASGGRSLPPNL
jgi:membrane protein